VKTKLLILISILSLLTGCHERNSTKDIEDEVDSMLPKLGVEYSRPLWEKLYEKVNVRTNDAARRACHIRIFEKLHSVKFVQGYYERQKRLFDEIHVHASFEPFGMQHLGLSLEELYAYNLRHFAWMREQLEVLKPHRHVDRNKMTDDELKRWTLWRNAYLYCKDYYEMQLGMLEKRYANRCDDYKVCNDERVRIEKMIVEFLERPIRSAQQVDADRKATNESSEMKAIWRCEVGP